MSSMPRRRLAPGIARGRIRPRPRTTAVPAAASAAPRTTVQAIGTLITAFTAIGALVFTGLSLNATRDQVEVAQQGQYTDRYTKAVEQLDQTGPEHLQTRLGGIYALQRLTIDSPRDQPTIVNVLVTFITSTIHHTDPTISPAPGCPGVFIAPDTQAALTVLIERDRKLDAGTIPDLRMRLRGACLTHGRLGTAYLNMADLIGASLIQADLGNADLGRATLNMAWLDGANLSNTNLGYADLNMASVGGADLRGANLYGTDLSRADLSYADLRGASLRRANLGNADLNGADLNGADLRGALLDGADLSYADLNGADLRGTRLQDTRHDNAIIDGAITDSETTGKWW